MELFIQFEIGSAISSFAILIVFTGISPLELLLQSILSINFLTWSTLTGSNLKLKEL